MKKSREIDLPENYEHCKGQILCGNAQIIPNPSISTVLIYITLRTRQKRKALIFKSHQYMHMPDPRL